MTRAPLSARKFFFASFRHDPANVNSHRTDSPNLTSRVWNAPLSDTHIRVELSPPAPNPTHSQKEDRQAV